MGLVLLPFCSVFACFKGWMNVRGGEVLWKVDAARDGADGDYGGRELSTRAYRQRQRDMGSAA